MADVLPLTPGLLISMAIRMDHGFGASFGPFGRDPRPLAEIQKETLDTVWKEYVDAYNGIPIHGQRLEECTGEGFYKAEREEAYLTQWGAQPSTVDYARLLVKRFEDLQALTPSRPTQA